MVLLDAYLSKDEKTDLRFGYWDGTKLEISMKQNPKEPIYIELSRKEVEQLHDSLSRFLLSTFGTKVE